MRRYFRESQQRAWKRLRKTGLRTVGDMVSGAAESTSYLASWFRRRAIQFEGEQTRLAYFFSLMLRLLRAGLILGGMILLYKYVHQHHNGLVARLHPALGSWGQRLENLPAVDRETALVLFILIVIGYFVAGRAHRVLARKSVRLPNGQLDT